MSPCTTHHNTPEAGLCSQTRESCRHLHNVEGSDGKDDCHVNRLQLEAKVEAEEQDIHHGALCSAEYPLAVPILVPRLIEVVERNPPVIVAAQDVTVCERGATFDVHAVRVGEDGQNGAPAQAAGCKHLAELPEGRQFRHNRALHVTRHAPPEAHHRESDKEHCQGEYAQRLPLQSA